VGGSGGVPVGECHGQRDDHLRQCVLDAARSDTAEGEAKLDELAGTLRQAPFGCSRTSNRDCVVRTRRKRSQPDE